LKAVTVKPGVKNSLSLTEVPEPRPKQNEAKLRVIRVGIDGTDRDINAGFYGAPPNGSGYLITAHECLAKVEEVGSSVSGFKKGDLVVPTVRRSCWEHCLNCSNGESDMCLTGDYFEHGIYKLHGFCADFGVTDANYLVRIPQEHNDVGVLLEPLSIVEKAIFQTFKIQERLFWQPTSAIVLGAGPIGLLATALLRLRGIETFAAARGSEDTLKARLVNNLGATYISTTNTPLENLNKKFDIIIEGTGNVPVALAAENLLATNGVLCHIGIYNNFDVSFDLGKILTEVVLRNKVRFGTVNSNKKYFEMGLDHFSKMKSDFGNFLNQLYTSRVEREDFAKAFQANSDEIKTSIEISS
jgi:threonine dehydrogenase-like Zn-dependent dehydrogenase